MQDAAGVRVRSVLVGLAIGGAAMAIAGSGGCGAPDPPPAADAPPAGTASAANAQAIPSARSDGPAAGEATASPSLGLAFRDVAVVAGLDFVHASGARGTYSYPEIVTGGACLADLDGDGDLDVYLPQSGDLPGDADDDRASAANALYLNRGDGTFERAAESAGGDDRGYGNGAFAADVDGDGDRDLLLTNVDGLVLLRNRGDATFEDATAASGPALGDRPGLWLNAAFGDFDGDGDLDAYVSNYTQWTPGSDPTCTGIGGQPDYCNPKLYAGATDLLLRNRGDGTFEDATAFAGIDTAATRSMGVVILDPDNDGDLDLYVANDGEANLLWINDGTGRFRDEAFERGCAVDEAGRPEAGMGVAVADVDRDGDEDMIVTHLDRETHTLYRNDGGVFTDASALAGLAWTMPDTGFGVGLPDLDHDGRVDLYVAAGGVMRPARPLVADDPYALADRAVTQDERGRFRVGAGSGTIGRDFTGTPDIARGAAFGDVDGDGDIDVLVTRKDGAVRLLRNDTPAVGGWIGLRPVERPGAASIVGTMLRVGVGATVRPAVYRVRPHGSYLGSSDDGVHVGLPERPARVRVAVTWPDGAEEVFPGRAAGRRHELVRGTGDGPQSEDAAAVVGVGSPANGDAMVAGGASGGDARTDADALVPARPDVPGSAAAGTIPAIRVERVDARRERVILDAAAVQDWSRRAGLPAPPDLEAYDAPTWRGIHAALAAAAGDPSAETLGDLAMQYHGHGPAAAAVATYRMAIGFEPKNARWWHLLGRLHLERGEAEQAQRVLGRAVTLDGTDTASVGQLAEAALLAGDVAAARVAWANYVALRPNDAAGALGVARAAEASGDSDAAWAAVLHAQALAPASRPVLVAVARMATRRGEIDAAAAVRARLDGPGLVADLVMPDARFAAMGERVRTKGWLRASARAFRGAGRTAEAYAVLRELVAREPDTANSWQVLTNLALQLGRAEAAVAHATEAVDLDPNFAPGWELIARSRLQAGDTRAAVTAIQRAVAADPEYARGRRTAGLILTQLQQWDMALAELDAGLQRQPADAAGHALRSVCLLQLGRRADASAAVDRAFALDPDNAIARQVRDALDAAAPGG